MQDGRSGVIVSHAIFVLKADQPACTFTTPAMRDPAPLPGSS